MFRSENIGRKSCHYVAKSSKKRCFGPRLVGEGIPQFQTCIFKLHLLPTSSEHVAAGRFWLSSVQRARGVADEKKNRW